MNNGDNNIAPYYKYHVFCCTNKRPLNHPAGSCARKMTIDIVSHMKDKVEELGLDNVRVNSSGCLGRCDNAPVLVVYPEGIWYQCNTPEDVDQVVINHLQGGKPVEHLILGSNN